MVETKVKSLPVNMAWGTRRLGMVTVEVPSGYIDRTLKKRLRQVNVTIKGYLQIKLAGRKAQENSTRV